jgi:AcrR family transcriptional regulator
MVTPAVEPSRRERKKDETRARIFKAAVRLFREKGFENTTIDDITERADVAKGTFFNYFPKKESVLGYLTETQLADAEEFAATLLQSRQPVRKKLIALFQRIASVYEEEPELSFYVMRESMRRAYTPSDSVHQHWHSVFTALIQQGQQVGELRADLDADRTNYVLGSVYMGTVFMWLMCQSSNLSCDGMTFNLQHELEARLSLVFDGVAARQEA